MRRMAVMAAGVGGVLALVIGAVSYMGPIGHRGVPVIEAPSKPVRVKPEHPGGMQVVGAGDFVPGGAEQLAPPPEKPAIRALRAKRVEHALPHEAVVPVKAKDPVVVAPATPPPTPVTAPAQPGGVAVQLAAFESEQAAQQDWGKMAEKMPTFFNGRVPVVERAQLAGRVVYRLRTGGFADMSAATAFCVEVRSKGGDCSVAAF
jgi:hypothetical protein